MNEGDFTRTQWLSAILNIDSGLLESRQVTFIDLYAYAALWIDTGLRPGEVCQWLRVPFQPTGQKIWAFLKNQGFVTRDQPSLPGGVR